MSQEILNNNDSGLVARSKINNNFSELYQADADASVALQTALANGPIVRVAANDSSSNAKIASQYVCDGVSDNVEIQSAIAFVSSSGGTVLLAAGTYIITEKLQINASNVHLIGDSGMRTQLWTSWASGDPIVHFVEVMGTNDAVRISGNTIANLSFVSDAPYSATPTGFIGHSTPGKPSGVLRGIWAQFVENYNVHSIYATRVSFITDTRNSNDLTFTNVTGKEIFGAVAVVKSTRVSINSIVVNYAENAVDLGDSSYAAISNVSGKASTARNTDELIDIGGSTNVVVSNCVSDGFYRGINVKYESNVAPSYINISNCIIRGQATRGILIDNVGQTASRMGPITVTGCQIQSTVSGSSGITVINNYANVMVANNTVNTHSTCILCDGSSNVSIEGNIVASTNGIGIRANNSSVQSVNNMITGNIISQATDGIQIGTNQDIVVSGNKIENVSGKGIWVFECKYPTVMGNILARVGTTAIHVEWNSTSNIDATNRYLNFAIDNNRIWDFSTAGAGQRGIWLECTSVTGDSVDIGSVSGNTIVATVDGQTVVNGIRFEGSMNWDAISITSNVISGNISNPLVITGGGTLESACRIKNNIGFPDV